jgi:hypothetical protein
LEGKDCYEVELIPFEGSTQSFLFDRESGLLAQMEMVVENERGPIPVKVSVEDYRDVEGGLRIPHLLRVTAMGQERIFRTTKVQSNIELKPDTFTLPPEIQKLLESEKRQP